MWRRWDTPQNFCLAFINKLEKGLLPSLSPSPPKNQKNQNFEKMKKNCWRSHFTHFKTPSHNHMRYGSWVNEWETLFFLFWVIYSPAIRTLMTSLLCLQQRPKEVTITWCFSRPLSNTHKIEQKIKKTHEKTKEKYNLHIHKEYASLPPGITLWKCISTWP